MLLPLVAGDEVEEDEEGAVVAVDDAEVEAAMMTPTITSITTITLPTTSIARYNTHPTQHSHTVSSRIAVSALSVCVCVCVWADA